MTEKKILWTDQQRRVITARGSDVLVTASAGTGKTAVLSGRCVDIISGKSDVRNLLVLTFTDAAAEQMRLRIAQQLKEAFERKPDNHLRYQLILLQGADISTIHSFCKRLITEYFYKLGLDPTFRVIDGDEQTLLKAEVLEETIDHAWGRDDLRSDLERLLYGRDLRTGDGFLAKVIKISNFLDGVVSRENWCERALRLAEITDLLTGSLGEKQKKIIAKRLSDIIGLLRHAQKLSISNGANDAWAQKLEETHIKPVTDCLDILETGRWDECAEAIRNFNKPRTYKPKGLPEEITELIKQSAKKAVDEFENLSQLAVVNPDYLDSIAVSAGLQTKVLIELVRQFDELYCRAKRSINCMDFADLEHYALKLLTDENSPPDKPAPSETALSLRQRYQHIFVDEYQDINSVQQQILRMLSPGGNILQVGDVKQSIYAFRGAEPNIFTEQLRLACIDPKNVPGGLLVYLNTNFRSAKGILDFVNKIFARIMTVSFTDIDYDESARLRPAPVEEHETSDAANAVVEFHILDETNFESDKQDEQAYESPVGDDLSLVTSRRRQAAMIARRIRQMVGAETGKAEFQVFDKEQNLFRDVQYRDIVVLMRSLAKKANDYVEVLRLAGVPVSSQASAGYFQATEISDCLSLLKVLDNPQRDIELAAVLRSPFFKLNDSDLAKIKIHNKKTRQAGDYYNCVLQYSKNGPDKKLADKLGQILVQIEKWRTTARQGKLADLIWQIYRRTGFLSFVSALPNGLSRRANLLKLHDRAIQFEGFASSSGIPSLGRFVEFFEKLQEVGQDWAPAEPQSSAGNAVRILSVHKSKGLEFPVVFLAELESGFNKQDIRADCLVDTEDTIGLRIIDRRTNSKLSSLAHQVIAEQKLATSLAEEMRILYVATTRARDRLILTASQNQTNCCRVITNGLFFDDESVPDWQLRACRNPLEWILYGLCDQKVLHEAFNSGLSNRAVNNNLFKFKLYDRTDLKQLSEFVINQKAKTQTRPASAGKKISKKQRHSEHLARIKESLSRKYQFGDSPSIQAKTSVTALTHRNDEYIKFDYSGILERRPRAIMTTEPQATDIVEPRLKGTAAHLVISRLDLAKPVNEMAVERTIKTLVGEKTISAEVAEHIDTKSIAAFFKSESGGLVLDSGNTVLREWPFTYALKISDWVTVTDESKNAKPSTSLHSVAATRREFVSMAATKQSEVDGPSSSNSVTTTDNANDSVIVQGIIDMLVRTPQGLVIVDFKTDNITAGQAEQRAEFYRRQLELYGRAASAILKSDVIARWLYFLTPGVSIEV
jgi:ATP-dependent helicase/nuclease subunit A